MSEPALTLDELTTLRDALEGYMSEWPETDDLVPLCGRLERIIEDLRRMND